MAEVVIPGGHRSFRVELNISFVMSCIMHFNSDENYKTTSTNLHRDGMSSDKRHRINEAT